MPDRYHPFPKTGLTAAAVLSAALSCALCCGTSAQAQTGQPMLDRWAGLLSKAGCAAPGGDPRWSEDGLVALALSFEQETVQGISDRARLDLYGYVREGNALAWTDDPPAVAEVFLSLTELGLARAGDAAGRPGFCALAGLIAAEPLQARVAGQEGRGGFYSPEQRLAQSLLGLHGCLEGGADGVFGPMSRAAWNRAVGAVEGAGAAGPDAPLVELAEGDHPTPGDILTLLQAGAERPLCAPPGWGGGADGAGAPVFPAAAMDLLALAADCRSGMPPARREGLGRLLAGAAGQPADLSRTLSALALTCDPEGGILSVDMAAELALSAALAAEGDALAAAGRGRLVADAATAHLRPGAPEEVAWLYQRLFDTAAALAGEAGQAGVGLGLMAALLETPEVFSDWFDPSFDITAALTQPDLPPDAVAALRAAFDRSPFALMDPATLARRVDEAIAAPDAAGAVALARDIGLTLDRLVTRNYNEFGGEEPDGPFNYAGMLRVDLTTTFAGIGPLMNLARLVGNRPEAGAALLAEGSGEVNFVLATALVEGFSGLPRSGAILAAARAHMQVAAEAGIGMAALRLAQMLDHGLGGPADPAAAGDQYRAAAEAGQPEAMLALARRHEAAGETAQAIEMYGRAHGARGPRVPDAAAVTALAARVALGEGVFALPEARALEEEQRRQFVAGNDYGGSAQEIAVAFLQGTGGLAPDPARAVDWLRISIAQDRAVAARNAEQGWSEGGDPGQVAADARLMLARILRDRPDLAARPMPAGLAEVETDPDLLLEGLALAGLVTGEPLDPATAPWLACEDNPDTMAPDSCVEMALRAATGGHGPAPIGPALDWLAAAAGAEAEEMRRHGRLLPREESYSRREAHASAGLAVALAWWGDWKGAREAVAPFASLPFAEAGEARHDQFRRLVARRLEGRAPAVWAEFEETLRAFAARGDAQSREILALVAAVAAGDAAGPAPAPDLAAAREAFAIAEPLGTGSPGLAHAARRLAPLEAAAGNRVRAVELELMALNTDLAAAEVDGILHGAVPADMTRVCGWSHASERLFALGETDLAVTLAELAVNRLQGLRAALTGVPEALQLCFRDQVTDHYRWLAGLYLEAGRPADADRVLMLLKDFETFRFVNRAPDFAEAAAAALAPQIDAGAVSAAIAPVQPTVTGQSIRRRELLLKRKQGTALSPEEEAELAALTESLTAAAATREAAVAEIALAVAAAGRPVLAEGLEEGRTMKRHLKELGEGIRAAAVQYVVLDGRLGIILTTPVSQRVFLQDSLGGAPLGAGTLAAAVAAFRADLTSPGRDPRPAAKVLHDLMFPPDLRAELQAGGVERLVLSLDGPLRHIPAAALHDGSRWLIEDFALSHVTGGGAPAGADAEVTELAGFGLTRSLSGFPALPGVARELAGITGPEGAALGASVWLDEEFTRDALSAALVFGDGFSGDLGVLHLASHFKLGRTEAESFLLMGDGSSLTVADLRIGLGQDLDFSDIAVLTLSACETGYVGGGAAGGITDGAELESFAAVAQQAGARSVAATLWPVQDASVAVLMQDFYRRAFPPGGGGADLALALAEAQRAMIAGQDGAGQDGAGQDGAGQEGGPGRGAEPLEDAGAPAPALPGHAHPLHWAPLVLLEGAG